MSSGRHVLVVEDNPDNQLLASAILERAGFTVDVAESTAGVYERLRDREPDLILMDIELAGEDGLDLTRQLKAQAATELIPVVALTAHAMAGYEREALAAGCTGYITKPIDTRTFVNQVKAFLRPQSPRPATRNHHAPEGQRL